MAARSKRAKKQFGFNCLDQFIMAVLLISAAVQRWPCCKYEQMQRQQQPWRQTATRSRRLMTLTQRSERTTFVRAGMSPANDRFGDMRCETELGSLQMQTYAASAKGQNRMTALFALPPFAATAKSYDSRTHTSRGKADLRRRGDC